MPVHGLLNCSVATLTLVAFGFNAAITGQVSVVPAPVFETASVKPNKSGDIEGSIGSRPDGYQARNISLRVLILRAYELRPFQLVGGPGWIDDDRFDLMARAPENTPQSQVLFMLRALLAERFKLVVHNETREGPIYALVTTRSDRRLSPGLRPSTAQCSTPGIASATGGPCVMRGSFTGSSGTLRGTGQPLAALAAQLGTAVDRIVVDRTDLAGRYDFELTWSAGGFRTGAELGPGSTGEGPSIFTAVQEQLGLRLQPSRGAMDVLVIDRVEMPTPN